MTDEEVTIEQTIIDFYTFVDAMTMFVDAMSDVSKTHNETIMQLISQVKALQALLAEQENRIFHLEDGLVTDKKSN